MNILPIADLQNGWRLYDEDVLFPLVETDCSTFHPPTDVGPGSSTLLTADSNADNIPDLVTLVAGQITIYPGNGDGTFQTPRTYSAGPNSIAIAIADLNQDSRPDLVVAASDASTLTILFGSVTAPPAK